MVKNVFVLLFIAIISININCYLFDFDNENEIDNKIIYYTANGKSWKKLLDSNVFISLGYPFDYYSENIETISEESIKDADAIKYKNYKDKLVVYYYIVNRSNNSLLHFKELKVQLEAENGEVIPYESIVIDPSVINESSGNTYKSEEEFLKSDIYVKKIENKYSSNIEIHFIFPKFKHEKVKIYYKIKTTLGDEVFEFENSEEIKYNFGNK